MQHIILLEDEPVLRREIADYLREQSWQVSEAGTIADFDRLFKIEQHGVAIIDLGLPDGDGLDLIARLRSRGLTMGIIVLTAVSAQASKLKGMSTGADHYLSKNVSLEELAVTIASLSRRLDMEAMKPEWVLCASGRKLTPPGQFAIDLSAQDYAVLQVLMATPDSVVSRRRIVETLGSDFFTVDPARLDTQMRRLRKKVFDAIGEELPVKTLRNEGYQFYAPARIQG